jgi:MFS transporter, OFA family, oxalate/formate antiporter
LTSSDPAETRPKSGVPRSLTNLPFFYGWLIVLISCLSGFLGSGLNNVSMGVVLKPMSEDLGWSRTLTAGAISIGTFTGALLIPYLGRVTDRIGPRLLLPGGGAIVAALSIGLAFIQVPVQFYLTYVPARALASATLIGVIPVTAVANWFYEKRARAIGIVNMSLQLGASTLVIIYQLLIDQYGWRSAFELLGVLILLLVVIPGFLILRRSAEDVGMHLDGIDPVSIPTPTAVGKRAASMRTAEHSWTVYDAVRTRALWLVIGTFSTAVMAGGGIAFHMVAYYTDLGIPPVVAAASLSLYAFCGALASGIWGYLAERIPPRQLSAVAFGAATAAIVMFMHVNGEWMGLIVAAYAGLAARGVLALMHLVLANYFGRRSYGAISGITGLFQQSAGAVGPFVAAFAFDATGTYQGILTIFAVLYLIATLLILFSRPPVPRLESVAG